VLQRTIFAALPSANFDQILPNQAMKREQFMPLSAALPHRSKNASTLTCQAGNGRPEE
jgi:hypothetical protein